mmetsp:Transcript_21254/g.41254  ORF Transcript_21254/g.41254 Transcript_21254/m.41254 type:complete len:316 (-) Transcript_21254:187-1134(-)
MNALFRVVGNNNKQQLRHLQQRRLCLVPRFLSTWPRHDHVPIYLVDAFADAPFQGNPAAVCLLPEDVQASDRWMQQLAMEMNQAETAFLSPIGTGKRRYSLRWFTPVEEVDLCGHATLASAKVLYESKYCDGTEVEFETRSGVLTARFDGHGGITLEFPNEKVDEIKDPQVLEAVAKAMTCPDSCIEWIGETRFDFFVHLSKEEHVRGFEADMNAIAHLGRRGTMITAQATESQDIDYVARFFAPQLGIPEDPVTGSAHCSLGPYWANKLDKDSVKGFQASKRGGQVDVTIQGDRVKLEGGAIITMKGELKVLVL